MPSAFLVPMLDAAAPCAAWSGHAADLASVIAAWVEPWEESPSLQSRVHHGDLLRLRAGLYIPPGVCTSSAERAVCVGIALGAALRGDHVIAGASACWTLLGGRPPEQVEIISRSHRTVIAGVLARNSRLPEEEVEVLGGAPVTVPGRTATDLLRFHPPDIASAAVASLLRSGHVAESEIRDRLRTLHGAPGSRLGARVLDLAIVRAASAEVTGPRDQAWTASGALAATCLPSDVTRYAS